MADVADRVRQQLRFIFNREFSADVRHTYFALRATVATIGISLPVVLVLIGALRGIPVHEMSSLSAFYWLPEQGPHGVMRDWFVGSLVAIGVCLIIYDGYGHLEDWLLNAAGVAVILVALNPMPWEDLNSPALPVHYASAIVFFLLIAITIWCCARQTLVGDVDAKTRKRWIAIYNVFSFLMAIVPVLAWALGGTHYGVIGAEVGGTWVFALYWIFKTHEVAHVSGVEPRGGPAPKLQAALAPHPPP